MIKYVKRYFSKKRAQKIAGFIYPLLSNGDRVLDFGCGDLLIAESLHRNLDVKITGIDVIDINLTSLSLKTYDGKNIPFVDNYFDITYAGFAFHHINNIEFLLSECIRVTKRRIIILEDIYENNFELLITKALDYSNKLMSWDMDIPLRFKTKAEWMTLFNKLNIKDARIHKIRPVLLRPTRHRLFVLDLR